MNLMTVNKVRRGSGPGSDMVRSEAIMYLKLYIRKRSASDERSVS